ncbi:MAG: hypothetical protein HON65_06275 [Rhodospirillales bacterium]|jgi:CheY-like chemotaxis protein/HPt (histidine-containing phosphotransfer) domain-containing protein|nr:hypothetical protein [Rhodospirillales bacterium]
MTDIDDKTDKILAQLSQEFIESARDQLDDIDNRIEDLEANKSTAEDVLIHIKRNIHNIKGQGATFGFPMTGRVAHMLEDYLINMEDSQTVNITDIRIYMQVMTDLLSTGDSLASDDPQGFLRSLPTGREAGFSSQETRDIAILLVMPSGLQRKMMATELLSCGFRVMRAYDSIEAVSVALDIVPNVVFVNYDMTPFNGRELSNVYAAIDELRDIRVVLLSSYGEGDERLQNLPDSVSVVKKDKNFMESIGELLIEWKIFGEIR